MFHPLGLKRNLFGSKQKGSLFHGEDVFFNQYRLWAPWPAVKQPEGGFNLTRVVFLLTADVEAFAKAMESETKSEQEGDSKEKRDDDEDMSLDWEQLNYLLLSLFIRLRFHS